MLLVSTKRLTGGMCTAAPVRHPRRAATRLVEHGVALTDETIARLRQVGVPLVWVKHPLVQDLEAAIRTKVPEKRRAIYETLKAGFDSLQDRVITTQDYRQYCNTISELITELVGQGKAAGDLAERLFNDGEEMASHCANVSYLAITVGMHLEAYIGRERRNHARPSNLFDLTSLGVGAMLHDIGKLKCAEAARGQHAFADEHADDYDEHALNGFNMLRQRINPLAAAIALHHHQRWDGTGWPDMTRLTYGRYTGGLSGRKIHIFSRIVAAANMFDALTVRPDGSSRPSICALRAMQCPKLAGAFDPIVLNAFLRHLPPFPVGVEVILNDGRAAAVMALNPDQPCRPTVRPLESNPDGVDLDLMSLPDMHIQESQGFDVTRWLYALPSAKEVRDAAEAETIVMPTKGPAAKAETSQVVAAK